MYAEFADNLIAEGYATRLMEEAEKQLAPLDGVGESTSSIIGPYSEPLIWSHPSEQV